MTLKNTFLVTITAIFAAITLTIGFISINGFYKLISMEPIVSTQISSGLEAHSNPFTLFKDGSVVVGLRYTIKSTTSHTPSKFSLPFEYRITDQNGNLVSAQTVAITDDTGHKYKYSFFESSDGWSSSATDLQPSISVRRNVPYRITAKVAVPDSAQYVPESLELRVYDSSDQVDIFRLTLMVVGSTMSGLISLGLSIALWLSMRRKPAAVTA